MSEDIFVPKSRPEDALVGPLHTVTLVTAEPGRLRTALTDGYGLTHSGWAAPSPEQRTKLNPYFGLDDDEDWTVGSFSKEGDGANITIRVITVDDRHPTVRPSYEGLYTGGATVSFPITDLRKHEQRMSAIGVKSTIGVKEMEFQSPEGETYVSAEIVYEGPDNIFLLGVTRPGIFVPVGPIDNSTGLGGPAYSARCITQPDATIAFFNDVLGYEIRRDIELQVTPPSAINLPDGVAERFVQGFAPGSSTGYIVLMDHGDDTKFGSAPDHGPPNRGIGIWSFPTADIDSVFERAKSHGADVLFPPGRHGSPLGTDSRTLLMKDPDGFLIEILETAE